MKSFNIEDSYIPCLVEENGIILNVNSPFLDLLGFSKNQILNKPLALVWSQQLRINIEPFTIYNEKEAFIFTQSLEVLLVNIIKETDYPKNRTTYKFIKIADSNLTQQLSYIDYLRCRGNTGVAIYSSDLILLKANQLFLDYLDTPYNIAENSLGRSIYAIVGGFKGSLAEENWMKVLNSGEVLDVRGMAYEGLERGTTYWNTTVVPIYVKGEIKYLAQTAEEVTDLVKDKEIKFKKEQMELILENMKEALFVYDKAGNLVMMNKAGREGLDRPIATAGESLEFLEYFDLDGNRLSFEDTPNFQALQGNTVKEMKMYIKSPQYDKYFSFNSCPIFDKDNNLLYAVITSRDITEKIKSQEIIELQQEQLLRVEKEKNEALQEALILKDEFIYLITHEFRTPMAVVSSALQAINLLYSNEITPNISKYLNMIKQNTNRQLRLVNNLLDISRINSGMFKFNLKAIDIIYVTRAIVSSVEVYSKQKGVVISFNTPIEERILMLDEEKYERILLNLLTNALKFTPSGKKIFVAVNTKQRKGTSMISISVTDEGIGIPKDRQKVIFDKFGQAETSLSKQAEGTGLGLHLVKLLVNALDGEIFVESSVGKGSKFTVLLPIIEAPTIDEVAVAETDSVPSQMEDRLIRSLAIEFEDIYN